MFDELICLNDYTGPLYLNDTCPGTYFALAYNILDFADSDINHPNDKVLLECPPTKTHPDDLGQVIGIPVEQQKNKKYYVSELIGISPNEEPPYHLVLGNNQDHSDELISFGKKFFQLQYGDDLCDNHGIKYVGKYLRHYCPHSGNYNALKPEQAQFIDVLFSSDAPVIVKAIEWADCPSKE